LKQQIRARIHAAQRNGSGTRTLAEGVTRCAVCCLPDAQRRRVDRELIEESVSLGAIAKRIGVGKSSIKRHADRHVKPAVIAEVQRIESGAEAALAAPPKAGDAPDIRKGVRPVVERLYERCAEWMDKAKDDASWPMFIACAREARQSAELVGRLSGELGRAEGTNLAVQIVYPAGSKGPPSAVKVDGIECEIIKR
jgi:hypothetical protein